MSTSPRRQLVAIAALIVAAAAAVGVASGQVPTAPRLRDGRVAADIPRAFGGGEVVLELTIDSEGSVAEVKRVRMTPPYLDFVVKSVTPWRFTPATAVLDGRVTTVAAPVLVVAVFGRHWCTPALHQAHALRSWALYLAASRALNPSPFRRIHQWRSETVSS